MPKDLTCIYSTVRNASGGTRNFPFLPPHGRVLTDGQHFTMVGTPQEAVTRGRFGAETRNLEALELALESGELEIVHTPAIILEDTLNGRSKMVKLQNGNLSVTEPCYESESH
jgi:hypothetical protein